MQKYRITDIADSFNMMLIANDNLICLNMCESICAKFSC